MAYSFKCNKVVTSYGIYFRCSWVVDKHYRNSRLRFPHRCSRDTDEEGAKRFCRKHDLKFPD